MELEKLVVSIGLDTSGMKKGVNDTASQMEYLKKIASELSQKMKEIGFDTSKKGAAEQLDAIAQLRNEVLALQKDLKKIGRIDISDDLAKKLKDAIGVDGSIDAGVEEISDSIDKIDFSGVDFSAIDIIMSSVRDAAGEIDSLREHLYELGGIPSFAKMAGGQTVGEEIQVVNQKIVELAAFIEGKLGNIKTAAKGNIKEVFDYIKANFPAEYLRFNMGSGAPKGNGGSGGDKSPSSGSGLSKAALTIGKAMLGVRGLYMLIRKIVSQNEKLQSALQTVFTTLANVLEPVLNFVASILNGVSTALSKIFKVSTVNKNANEKTANNTACFDELNVINPESSSSTTNPEDDKSAGALIGQGLVDIIVGLLEIILGAVELVLGVIGVAIYGLTAIVEGAILLIELAILAVVETVIVIIMTIVTVVSVVIATIVATIVGFFEGIWVFFETLLSGGTLDEAFNAFKEKFSEAFGKIMGWVDTKIIQPMGRWVLKIARWFIDYLINPAIDGLNAIIVCFAKCINLCIRGIEWIANGFVDVVNGIVAIINAIPGVNVGYLNRVSMKRMSEEARIPKLNTGTNYVETEGLAYLHEGEAVVPKKYNPAADGVGNREVVDALYTILDALNEKDMSITIGDDVIGRANNRYNTRIGKTIISGSFADVY